MMKVVENTVMKEVAPIAAKSVVKNHLKSSSPVNTELIVNSLVKATERAGYVVENITVNALHVPQDMFDSYVTILSEIEKNGTLAIEKILNCDDLSSEDKKEIVQIISKYNSEKETAIASVVATFIKCVAGVGVTAALTKTSKPVIKTIVKESGKTRRTKIRCKSMTKVLRR